MQPGDSHARANRKSPCIFSRIFNHTHHLVSGNYWRLPRRQFALNHMQVRAAHPASVSSHANFALPRHRNRHFSKFQRIRLHFRRCLQHAGFHRKTSFGSSDGSLRVGSRVNLERPLTAGKEFGGHFVLGHVDTVGQVTHLTPEGENWSYGVRVPEDFACYIVPKGSISIDGISLTVARWDNRTNVAEAAIIPYTYDHSNIRDRKPGDAVNLEADILGKYIENYLEAREKSRPGSALTIEELVRQGF